MIENDQEVTRHSVDETNERTKMTALNFFLEMSEILQNSLNSRKFSKNFVFFSWRCNKKERVLIVKHRLLPMFKSSKTHRFIYLPFQTNVLYVLIIRFRETVYLPPPLSQY